MRRLYNAACYYLEVRAKQIYHDIYPPEHVEPEPAVPPQGAESQAELSGTRHLHDDALHSDQYRLARVGFTLPPPPNGDHLLTETHRRLEQ